jgi:hypothetical protein
MPEERDIECSECTTLFFELNEIQMNMIEPGVITEDLPLEYSR